MIQVILRALRAVDYLVDQCDEGHQVSLQEIAEFLGMQPTTVRNILRSLEEAGYVGRPGHGRYVPGPKIENLMRRSAALTLAKSAESTVLELSRQTGESVVLTTLIGPRRQVLLHIEGERLIGVNATQAENAEFHSLATNRVMLAYLSDSQRKVVMAEHLFTDGTERELHQSLERIRKEGIFEYSPNDSVCALACPVFGSDGQILAALGLYLPQFRATDSRRTELRLALIQTAKTITETLAP